MSATQEDLAHPEFLVGTEWLAAHLGQPGLCILDCTVHIAFNPVTMFEIGSGAADFEHGHIPGAAFVDVLSELSDTGHPVPLMAPDAMQFASVMSAHGVADGSSVVLYSAQNVYWATRVWWLFRMFGFDGAAVLNGGLQKWRREGRPVETGPARLRPPAQFTVRRQRALMAGKDEVLGAIGDATVCIINALPEDQHRFTSGVHYGRPGHILGSVNLPSGDLLDAETYEFLPLDELRRRFDQVGAFGKRVVTYCGGGAAASADAMALVMLGHPDVKLYDGSLLEWATDPSLPIEVDPVPVSPNQAVIAIENRRLLDDLREALAQQAAMSEILQIINTSPGELGPVFDAILEKAHTLCGAVDGTLFLRNGDHFRAVAIRGRVPEQFAQRLRQGFVAADAPVSAPLLAGEAFVHIPDLALVDHPIARAGVEISHTRTLLSIPLRKGDEVLGMIVGGRKEVRPFSGKQIALLENFAAQAVIAMENARLLGELRQRTADLEESLEYQTATSDVLKVISRSTFDVQPVLQTVLATAVRLCSAGPSQIWRLDGDGFRYAVGHLQVPEYEAFERSIVIRPGDQGTLVGRTARARDTVHVLDAMTDPLYAQKDQAGIQGFHTMLGVPLMRDGEVIGVIALSRWQVEPFSERQIELVRTFAAQAVIAMENARLITETREALEQQTATAEVLQVINSSLGDLVPVFDAMLDKALHLCSADYGALRMWDGERLTRVAWRGPHGFEDVSPKSVPAAPGSLAERFVRGEDVISISDLVGGANYQQSVGAQSLVRRGNARTFLGVALRKDARLLGTLVIYRQEVRPFTETQIALLQNFAAQAVIAIENARLFGELREALEQQTANAEILQVINASPGELQPVFEAILEKGHQLCGVAQGSLQLYDGERFSAVAVRGLSGALADRLRQGYTPSPTIPVWRVLEGQGFIHTPDLAEIDDPLARSIVTLGGTRTMLWVALRRDDKLFGLIAAARLEVRPFSEKEIALLQSFATQAVIAMDNARLLGEIRQRQAELRVTFDNMGDGVAMFDAEHRLAAWNRNFQQLLGLPDELLRGRPSFDEYIRYLATHGEYGGVDVEAEVRRLLEAAGRQWSAERTRPDGRVIEVRVNPVPGGGIVLIYGDVTERKRAEAEIRGARDAAEKALGELQAAQQQLVVQQKMAALGELTAGIAHEIKNPLNFVNNFAGLSVELLDELKASATPVLAALEGDARAEIEESFELLTGNLDKIAEHGRRADGIVNSMLAHSRGGSGERREVDLNALVEEALNLAYHGARAQDQSFNITLERDLATELLPIELVPQDVTRVFLNLFGNGFYAAQKRAREAGDGYQPLLKVATRGLGETVEIRVRDNGTGIPPEMHDRLFQPFFTTKPTGEGTGLGLSISWDIVTQQHGGTISVESEPGAFTEFTVRLPRHRHAAVAGGGR